MTAPQSPGASRRQTDAALVARLRAGDRTAYAALYEAHAPAVRLAVGDRVQEPQARADLVQEAFTRALERLDDLRDPGAFRPWLLSIARNAAVDQRRGERWTADVDDDVLVELGDPVAGPEDHAELAELAARVRSNVVHLSRRDATALTLVTRFGLSTQDLAAALDVSPGAAKVALHRARTRLRQALRLETLAHRSPGSCDELRRLYDDGDHAAATRHLADCPACRVVDAEVEGFAHAPAGLPTARGR